MGVKCKTFLAVFVSRALPVFPLGDSLALADHRFPPLRPLGLQTPVGLTGSRAFSGQTESEVGRVPVYCRRRAAGLASPMPGLPCVLSK